MTDANFLTGLMQGFGNVMLTKQNQAREDEMRKLQKKALNIQLEMQQKQMSGKQQLTDMISGHTLPPDQDGPVVPGMSALEALSSPQGQSSYLQSGGGLPELINMQVGLAGKGLQNQKTQLEMQELINNLNLSKKQQAMFDKLSSQFLGGESQGQTQGQTQGQGMTVGGMPIDPVSAFAAVGTMDLGKLKSMGYEPIKVYNQETGADDVRFVNAKGEYLKQGDDPVTQPGKPQQLSSQEAARSTAAQTGVQYIKELRNEFFDEKGKLKPESTTLMFLTKMRIPGTREHGLMKKFEDTIDAVVRARTGATATIPEMENMISQFVPSTLDKDETIKDKFYRLENFLQGTIDMMNLPEGTKLNLGSSKINKPKEVDDATWAEIQKDPELMKAFQ